MKILKIQQNSEEWLEFRKGKSGGSEFKDLWIPGYPLKTRVIEELEKDGQPLSPADKRASVAELAGMLEPYELAKLKLEGEPKDHYYEIIADAVARPITPNDYIDELNGEPFSMMARGHILEPKAIEAFESQTGKIVDKESCVWIMDSEPGEITLEEAEAKGIQSYISPDGCITDEDGIIREAIEVKCLSSAKVVKAYLEKKYPKEYEPQIIKYFMVNENLEKLYFLMYTDVIPGLELQIFEIKREDIQDRIVEAMAFEIEILKRITADTERIKALSF